MACQFSGAQWLTCGTTSDFTFFQNTGIFTFSVRFRMTNYTTPGVFNFFASTSASAQWGFQLYYSGGAVINRFGCFLARGASGLPTVDSVSMAGVLSDNDWHHLVIRGSGPGNAIDYFLDGVLLTSSGTVGTLSGGPASNPAAIGHNGLGSGFFNGAMADMAIWDKALDNSQCISLHRYSPFYVRKPKTYWRLSGRRSNTEPDLFGYVNATPFGVTHTEHPTFIDSKSLVR